MLIFFFNAFLIYGVFAQWERAWHVHAAIFFHSLGQLKLSNYYAGLTADVKTLAPLVN